MTKKRVRGVWEVERTGAVWLHFLAGDRVPLIKGDPKCVPCGKPTLRGYVELDGAAPGRCLCEAHFFAYVKGEPSSPA